MSAICRAIAALTAPPTPLAPLMSRHHNPGGGMGGWVHHVLHQIEYDLLVHVARQHAASERGDPWALTTYQMLDQMSAIARHPQVLVDIIDRLTDHLQAVGGHVRPSMAGKIKQAMVRARDLYVRTAPDPHQP
ncbi:hypothetical protein P7L78_22135 [Tistrella bauzanensis]|uniref:hypothetical protein n=1 Tax=Tistrella TaxID=171436 RepID=UPI0031F6A65E